MHRFSAANEIYPMSTRRAAHVLVPLLALSLSATAAVQPAPISDIGEEPQASENYLPLEPDDLVSRAVDLLDASCSIDRCEIVSKPHASAAGLYFARIV
jgi:hypothetical protein